MRVRARVRVRVSFRDRVTDRVRVRVRVRVRARVRVRVRVSSWKSAQSPRLHRSRCERYMRIETEEVLASAAEGRGAPR